MQNIKQLLAKARSEMALWSDQEKKDFDKEYVDRGLNGLLFNQVPIPGNNSSSVWDIVDALEEIDLFFEDIFRSYTEKRIAKKLAEDKEYRLAFEEEMEQN